MRYDLATLARRQRNIRRPFIVLRDINPPSTLATSLYTATYARVLALWQRRSEAIITQYEHSLAQMTQDSPSDIQGEIEAAQSEFERIALDVLPELRDWVMRVEAWQRGRWRGAVLSATGVDLGTLIGPQDHRETLEAYLRWNTGLIRDVSEQARKRIADRVFSGLTQRKPARDVAKEIREAVAMSRRRSISIASDQLSKLTGSLADERRRDAGLPVWEFVHSRKLHPRVAHQRRNGDYYTDDPALIGKVVDGKTIKAAPPLEDRPSYAPYCGCRSRAVILWD